MKNITLIHFAYPPNTGGVEILLREQALILADLGFNINVLTGAGAEDDKRIKLTIVPEFQSVLSFNPQLQEKILTNGIIDDEFEQTAILIEKKLTENLINTDIIIIHNMLTLVRNLPFVQAFHEYVKNHPEKKFVIWTHDHSYINEFIIKDMATAAHSEKEKKLLTTAIPNVTYVVISETFKKPLIELMNLPADKVLAIPDGINMERFLEIDKPIYELIQRNNLLSSFPILLSPVNILARKNLDYCVEIVKNLKTFYPNIRYIITGNPSQHRFTLEYLNKLKSMIKEYDLDNNILFFGEIFNRYLKDSEMHDLYDIADAVLFISKSENFGLPLIEAALSKTPIFVSELAVFHEILGDNVQYIDYKTITPDKAAAIIKNYIENNKLIKANFNSRNKYDLLTITRELLLPLLNS